MGRFLNVVVCHLKSTRVAEHSGRSGKYVACYPGVNLEGRTAHCIMATTYGAKAQADLKQ